MKRSFLCTLVVLCGTTLTTLALLGPDRLWGQRLDLPVTSDAFTVSYALALELDGEIVAFFDTCRGLVSASDVQEHTVSTAGQRQIGQRRPGNKLLWEDLVLTRRVGGSSRTLWQWRQQIESGDWDVGLRDGAIVLHGPGGEDARWNFTNGWPVRLSVNESVEEVTIAHDGLQRVYQ